MSKKYKLTEEQSDFLSQIICSLHHEEASIVIDDERWYPNKKSFKILGKLYTKIPQSVRADWLTNWASDPVSRAPFNVRTGNTILYTYLPNFDGTYKTVIRGVVISVEFFPEDGDGIWQIILGNSTNQHTIDYDPNNPEETIQVLL